MKVTRTTPLQAVEPTRDVRERAPTQSESPAADSVTLSSDAAFVDRARASVTDQPVRTELVEQVKASIQAGTFEASVDLEATVGSLLADL
jgi:flagellar biosynthesis anti-sigma factor FlgM